MAARDWRQSWRRCLLGLGPLAAWFLFAIVYYGFPYPNTAYAKLNTAIPLGAHIAQGLSYLTDSVFTDPLVLPVILLSVLATCGPDPGPGCCWPTGWASSSICSTSAGSAGTSCRDGS